MLVDKPLNLEQLAKEMQVPGLVQRGDDLRVQLKNSREIELTPEQQALVDAHVAKAVPTRGERFAKLIDDLDATKPDQIKGILRKIAGVENGL